MDWADTEFMELYKNKKILLLNEMLELGENWNKVIIMMLFALELPILIIHILLSRIIKITLCVIILIFKIKSLKLNKGDILIEKSGGGEKLQ